MTSEKLAATVDYVSSNRSLRNTTFTSPDGRYAYIVETPFKRTTMTTTLSKRDTQTGHTAVLAILEFKALRSDMVTLQGAQPVPVKQWLPRKNFGWYVTSWSINIFSQSEFALYCPAHASTPI